MPAKAGRLEILSWCLYDFADSSYTTLIVTVAYAVYFRTVVAGHLGAKADFFWGLSVAVSMVVVAVTSPILGAIADVSGRKKQFLAAFALTSIVFTALLSLVQRGDLAAGMLLFILANVGYEGAHAFYNGFLPEIASDREMGRISGYGWAIGYLGGLAALFLTRPLLVRPPGPHAEAGSRLAFVVVALFYLVFTLPILLLLKERAARADVPLARSAREGVRRFRDTFRQVRGLRDLFLFLVAFIIYNDGVMTVITYSTIFATQVIKFTMGQVMILFIVTQITAFVGALAAGFMVDHLGSRPTILCTLALWSAVVCGVFVTRTVPGFYVAAIAASIGMGSTQTASRSLMGLLIPGGQNAEFFGFYGFTGKISAVAGPLIYGGVAALAGSERPAVLSLLPFFAIGFILLLRVDVDRGRAAARGIVA